LTGLLRRYIVVLALVTISGCASLVKPPHVTVLSSNVVSVDTAGFDIELLIGVDNPNLFDVSLLGYTYELQVMSVPMSGGGPLQGVFFPSGQVVDVRLPFRIHHTDLLGVIKRRPDFDRIPYSVDAKLNLATPFGEIVIPVKKSGIVSVPIDYRPGTFFKRMLQPLKEIL
jgi:LEA14-like dessication related protein